MSVTIVYNIDSSDVFTWPFTLSESRHRSLWSLHIIITLTESALLIAFAIWDKKIAGTAGD